MYLKLEDHTFDRSDPITVLTFIQEQVREFNFLMITEGQAYIEL